MPSQCPKDFLVQWSCSAGLSATAQGPNMYCSMKLLAAPIFWSQYGHTYLSSSQGPRVPSQLHALCQGCSTVSCRRELSRVRRACLELIHGLWLQKQWVGPHYKLFSPVQLQKSWESVSCHKCSELVLSSSEVVTFMSSQWAPVAIGLKTVPIQDLTHLVRDLERKKEKSAIEDKKIQLHGLKTHFLRSQGAHCKPLGPPSPGSSTSHLMSLRTRGLIRIAQNSSLSLSLYFYINIFRYLRNAV